MVGRPLLWCWMDCEGTLKPRMSLRGFKHCVAHDLLLSVLALSEAALILPWLCSWSPNILMWLIFYIALPHCQAALGAVQNHEQIIVGGGTVWESPASRSQAPACVRACRCLKPCPSFHPSLSPVDVILDPETAHPDLTVSEDRKSVRRGSKKLLLSLFDNPKRFGTTPVVLGSPGFFSGRHYWEVQVGDKPEWGLGLCREAAGRKGTVLFSPNNGYWVLRLQNGGTYEALTVPVSPLTLSVRPRRVGIFLDYEAGEISFYNVSDRSHIYTFTDKFSGNLRPLFFLGAFLGGRNAEPLVISWVRDPQGTGCIIL